MMVFVAQIVKLFFFDWKGERGTVFFLFPTKNNLTNKENKIKKKLNFLIGQKTGIFSPNKFKIY